MANRLKLKEIREIKGLTQDDVVRLSGVPKRSYNDYESGKTDIPSSRLQDIASALGITVGTLFGYSDPETRDRYEDRVLEDTEYYVKPKIDDTPVSFDSDKHEYLKELVESQKLTIELLKQENERLKDESANFQKDRKPMDRS